MKRVLALFTVAVLVALVLLARQVTRAPSDVTTPTKLSASFSNGFRFAGAARELPSDQRVAISTDKPIEPGLPPWTVMLATMPAAVPAPAGSALPAVPDGALVPMR